ncbi:MAG: carboxypeptidase regulatory-like domain-containing protein, partial [Candidatus Thermoplasmatota archaeon]|nr:carboxypeptidase regulatory-like domain-containing protein [Candidatus Thermoplasmatota archaeon]
MARQTRRRRDSRSKTRFRPRLASAFGRAGSEEKETRIRKTEKVNWTTVFTLLAIFLFSLYIRTAWTLEPATEDGFELTGGSDPYYHKRVVDYVMDNGQHLQRDPMLNYPYGANNNRPPLFDWSIAIVGLALSPLFESTEESVWWAMEVLPAFYGALIIFPVYAIGRAQFGKEAGLVGAFLIGINSGHVSHSSLALADHDSYIILFGTTAFFFFMRALTVANDRKWVSDWSDWKEIKKGLLNFAEAEKLALGYAGLSGITITMISLSWKGFPYIMGIIAIYLGFQMLINAFQRVDSLTTASLGLVTMSMPVIFSYPYYHTMGFVGTWWEAPAYILLGYVLLSLLMVTTRDLPWLLVIGSSAGMATAIYLLLTYVFEELGFLLFSGQGYFVRTKLFNTIAEAQPPEFADFVFAFGPVSIWLAIFGIIWMGYQLFNQNIWKKDYVFVMIWALVSIYMAQSAVRFIFNATPVVSLISGWMTWLIIQWADFPATMAAWKAFWGKRGDLFFWLALLSTIIGIWLFFTIGVGIGVVSTIILLALVMVIGHMDAQGEDQYRFRDRLSGMRKAFELRRPLIALFVGLFIFLPNTFYGYDAAVPFEDKKDHDVAVYDFLSYDFLRPDEFMYNEKSNATLYPEGVGGMYNKTSNQLWYLGNTGPSFPQDYWIEGLGWLAEQDTHLEPEDRPGFISWWDYGFWAIDIGEHPTVADNFQFGYQIAGNFIASQSEHEAMALLLYRLLEPEVDRDTGRFGDDIRILLLEHLSEDNVTEFETIILNPEDYIPKKPDGSDQDVHKKNAAIRAGKPILMTMEKSRIADLMWDVEQITGNSIRYFAADTRLMPYSADNTGILYAPVTLADYDISNFFEVQAVLSNGQTVSFAEAVDIVKEDPSIQVTDQKLIYKEKFLNSTFFRAFIGWSGPDIGRSIEDGIPGITGQIAQDQNLPPLFGWNMTHFKMAHTNGGLRILKYYDCATIYGTIATPNGDPVANANVTVLDENKIPHATVTTGTDGKYSILVPAGNLTLTVSLGAPETDREKIFKTSNNILITKNNVIISEEQAMRQTASEINIDMEVDPASIAGRLYWDMDKDEEFGTEDSAIPLIAVTASNIRSGISNSVTTDSNGNYKFEGLAPGEYEITAEVNGHHLDLKSYTGPAAIRAGQDVTVKGALEPSEVWGKFIDEGLGTESVTMSLYDLTNDSIAEKSFLSTDYHSSDCVGENVADSISFCFNKLLPGEYILRMESEDVFTGWTNNTIELELGKGEARSFNSSLMSGFRVEGTLSHNGNAIGNEQIAISGLHEKHSDNIFTTEEGYFSTVLPKGAYDIYTIHQTNQTTLAYLGLVDSETYSSPINAEMSPGHTIGGSVFDDADGDGQRDLEKEKGYENRPVVFDSGSGSTSVTTSYDGTYEVILPEGDYGAWSQAYLDETENKVLLKRIQVDRSAENVNLPAVTGQDVVVIFYEEHMGEILTLSG